MMQSRYELLSRREREVMDLVYEHGSVTAADVREGMADPPSYSAVRATLRILEEKGFLRHRQEGRRYVFLPTASRKSVRRRVLSKLVKTFFDGSPEKALAALIDLSARDLSDEELERLADAIDRAKKEGR